MAFANTSSAIVFYDIINGVVNLVSIPAIVGSYSLKIGPVKR